jgi:gamma-glutamyl-gamma-aminobutyrate hydrolase PuuD
MTWGLSVQWHPERNEMTDNPDLQNASTALFDAFVTAAKKYSLNSI